MLENIKDIIVCMEMFCEQLNVDIIGTNDIMIRARWLNIIIDKINMRGKFHLVLFLMRLGKETDFKRK